MLDLTPSPSSSSVSLPPIAYKGQPVVTTEMLAQVYGCSTNNIHDNFRKNRERFIEGKHFFLLANDELETFRNLQHENFRSQISLSPKTRSLTLWLERGAARHAKMLSTDKAWEVFEMLEETFFRKGAAQPALSREDILSQALEIIGGENAVLKQQLALDAPKVEFAEAISIAEGGVSVNRFAKILQQHGIKEMGPCRLYKDLRQDGFIIGKRGKNWNVPKQKYVERGWFRIVEYLTPEDDSTQFIVPDFVITGAGQQALLAHFKDKYGINRQLSLFSDSKKRNGSKKGRR